MEYPTLIFAESQKVQNLALIFNLSYFYLISKWGTEDYDDDYDYCIRVGDPDTMLLPTLKFVLPSPVWKQASLK